jgi:hypothetical protein
MRALWPAVVLLGAMTPRAALAEPPAPCVEEHQSAQRFRRAHKPIEARDELRRCSAESCPALIVQDCVGWLTEVERQIPSVVIDVRRDGASLYGARALIDGKGESVRLDGTAVEIDPGEHRVRIETDGGERTESVIVVREGEAAQRVTIRWPSPPPKSVERGPRIPAASWVLGGVGVVGLGAFTTFGLLGVSAKSDLDDSNCRPSCATSDVSAVRRDFIIADVSLAVGVVSLAAAVILYGVHHPAHD